MTNLALAHDGLITDLSLPTAKNTASRWHFAPIDAPVVMAFILWCAMTGRLIGAEPSAMLTLIENSRGLSEVLSFNSSDVVLGRREHIDGAIAAMLPYLRVGDTERGIPVPSEFTNVEVFVVNDLGYVVGFATRPVGHPDGNQRAFVWDYRTEQPETLVLPESFRGSCAFDISQDGRTVSGYLVGRHPPRILPCVWQRTGDTWRCQKLPCFFELNPLLASAHVVVSDNGQYVAASLITRIRPNGIPEYGLFLWHRDDDDRWTPAKISGRAVHLGDVNNSGTVAGRILEGGKRRAYVCSDTSGGQILPLPAGRVSSYATDINNHGDVVGIASDPPGPNGTTSAFLWRQGKLLELPLPDDVEMSTANTIDDMGRVGGALARRSPATSEPSNDIPFGSSASYLLQVTD